MQIMKIVFSIFLLLFLAGCGVEALPKEQPEEAYLAINQSTQAHLTEIRKLAAKVEAERRYTEELDAGIQVLKKHLQEVRMNCAKNLAEARKERVRAQQIRQAKRTPKPLDVQCPAPTEAQPAPAASSTPGPSPKDSASKAQTQPDATAAPTEAQPPATNEPLYSPSDAPR